MSDYTPTVEEVRTDYVLAYADRDSSQLLAGAAFDRFIAKVRDEAKADALREAAMKLRDGIGSCNTGCHMSDMMTLQTLADRIEGEA